MLRPPSIDPSHLPARPAPQTSSVEVVISWGHIQNVLLVAHVGAGERFVLGQDAAADFVLSAQMLGATEFVLVDSGNLRVPPAASVEEAALTAEQLRAGETSQFSLGEFSVRVRGVRSPKRVAPRGSMDRRPLVYVGGTMVFAGIMLAVMALSPTRGMAMSTARLDMNSRLVRYLVDEPTYEEPEPVTSLDSEFGIETASASASLENTNFDVVEPERASAAAHRPSRSSDEPVRAGVLEILERLSPLGNEPSPFSNPLGTDPMDAIGGHYGIQTGEFFGAGELSLDGVGRGAGGAGEGTVHLAAGAGTAHGADYGSGLGVLAPRVSSRTIFCGCGGYNSEVIGSLSRETIRRVVRRHRNEIRHCYERSLLTHPELDGRLMTRFLINPAGTVIGSSVVESSLRHAETESCVTNVLRRLTFPETDGGMVRVNYPFEFRAVGP